MKNLRLWWATALLAVLSFAALAFAQTGSEYTTPGMPGKVKTAIEKSLQDSAMADSTKAVIKPGEEPGFLQIPGAPKPNLILGLLWAVWVGWIFSTVGAFGGIMAGVGHITIFGLADYAKSFGKGNPVNSLVTDSIRVSNQWLVGLSALISSTNYYKMGRLVAPLGMCLAIGGVGGSWLIPALTAGKVNLKEYIGYFGLIVLILGIMLLRETTAAGQSKKKKAKEAAAAFEKKKKEGGAADEGVKVVEGSWGLMGLALALVVASALWVNLVGDPKWVAYILVLAGWGTTFFVGSIKFTFFGVEFNFKAFVPMLGGIFIAAIAAFLGIGGGFLFVPFLTSVAGLPMFLVAGTSALVVLVGMIVSIFTYMVGKNVPVSWSLIGVELIGIFIGSQIILDLNYVNTLLLQTVVIWSMGILFLYLGRRRIGRIE